MATHQAMEIPATYYDGRTSRPHQVRLSVADGRAVLAGEISLSCPLERLHVSERTRHAVRKVSFPDGAYLEAQDNAAFHALLAATGHRDSLVVRLQQSWCAVLAAFAALLLALVLGYLFVLPPVADAVARALPESAQQAFGRETLAMLDRNMFRPSALPAARRDAIVARFARMAPPRAKHPAYEILFRKSRDSAITAEPYVKPSEESKRIGADAFALPSGQIVLTDQMVALMDDDDALMGVLAHELGHLHERHLLRQVIQSSAIASATLLFGDISALLASIPAALLTLRYSREAEREADDYAIAMLSANGIPPSSLARGLEKLGAAEPPPYLSTHPPLSERIGRLRDVR